MSRFEPGFDNMDDPPPGFDDSTDRESPPWGPPVSGKAMASLVFGVMFCVPLVPSLLAILFGALGLRDTRDGSRTGRRLARAGLVLGGLGTALWLVLGSRAYLLATESTHAGSVAESFLHELADGKIDDALARAVPSTPKAPLAAAARAMADWGRYDAINGDILPVISRSPILRWEIDGSASFARAERDVYVRLVQDGRSYRVERFQLAGKWVVGGGRWGDPN